MTNEILETIEQGETIREDLVQQRDVIQAAIDKLDETQEKLRTAYHLCMKVL